MRDILPFVWERDVAAKNVERVGASGGKADAKEEMRRQRGFDLANILGNFSIISA